MKITLNQATERTPRANLMHWATTANINAGQAVSVPWAMCARGARHAAMKPPSIKPTERAAVMKRELSLFSSTKLPITRPTTKTTESEKNAPVSHELRFIR
jgi:hypothetical protein